VNGDGEGVVVGSEWGWVGSGGGASNHDMEVQAALTPIKIVNSLKCCLF